MRLNGGIKFENCREKESILHNRRTQEERKPLTTENELAETEAENKKGEEEKGRGFHSGAGGKAALVRGIVLDVLEEGGDSPKSRKEVNRWVETIGGELKPVSGRKGIFTVSPWGTEKSRKTGSSSFAGSRKALKKKEDPNKSGWECGGGGGKAPRTNQVLTRGGGGAMNWQGRGRRNPKLRWGKARNPIC